MLPLYICQSKDVHTFPVNVNKALGLDLRKSQVTSKQIFVNTNGIELVYIEWPLRSKNSL